MGHGKENDLALSRSKSINSALNRIKCKLGKHFTTLQSMHKVSLLIKRKPSIQEAAAMKQIKNTKQLLNIAEVNKWIINNPIEKFRCGSEEPEILP